MNHDTYPDAYIKDILDEVKTVAMIGASANNVRPSYFVLKYLLSKGYEVWPINPGQAARRSWDRRSIPRSTNCLRFPT